MKNKQSLTIVQFSNLRKTYHKDDNNYDLQKYEFYTLWVFISEKSSLISHS